MTTPCQVLIVDRNRALCEALSGLLLGAGYRVECLTGQASLQAVRDLAPEILVIDVPDASGPETELLKRIAQQRGAPHLPVIVTTPDPALEFELLDVFDVLPKPLNEERLLEDVALLAQRRAKLQDYASMSEVDLALFRDFLIAHSGLHFERRNALLLERGLRRRMVAVRAASYQDYLAYLDRYQESRQELKKLLGLLTIGETYFFRYQAHFQALAEVVVPEIVAQHRGRRRLRIWSAGCSTGEEPYSIAMLLAEHFPQLADWRVDILATDVNKRSLGVGRAGRYGPRALRATESVYREKYFHPVGERFQLDPRIVGMVRFGYFNLLTDPLPVTSGEEFDLIFCRNVMIYFQPETTASVVARLSQALRPGGYLFLGHAETLLHVNHAFVRAQHGGGFYYRLQPASPGRVSQPEPRASAQPTPFASAPRLVPPPSGATAAPTPPSLPALPALPALPPTAAPAAAGISQYYAAAVAAFEAENFKTASQNYAILLRHQPDHVGGLVGFGFLLANTGDYAAALDYCQRAQAVDDLYPEAYFLKGLIRELEGLPAEALLEYRRTLLLDMSMVITHYRLSRVFQRLDQNRDAIRELRNTLRILERQAPDRVIPYSGGMSGAALATQCRRELAQLEGPEAGRPVPRAVRMEKEGR